MARKVSDVLLRIVGDPDDARRDLGVILAELKAFGRVKETATANVDTAPAETALARAKRELKDFGRLSEQAKVGLDISKAEAQLQTFKGRLEALSKQEASPKVDIKVAATLAQIGRIEARLDDLRKRRVDVDVNVGRGASGVASGVAGAIGGAAKSVGAVVSGVAAFAGTAASALPLFGRMGMAMGQLGASSAVAGAAMVAIAVIAIPLIIAGLTLLLGALVAIGASLLAAAAAVGVFAITLAAALGPVIAVIIAAFVRFAKILEAVKAKEDQVASGATKVKDALEQQRQAQEALGTAQQRVKDAAVEAYRAQAQAAEDVSDAVRGIAQAELSRDQAQLNVEKAEENLKALREEAGLTSKSLDGMFAKFSDVDFNPEDLIGEISKSAIGGVGGTEETDLKQGILDLRGARLNEKDAIDGVSDAHTRLDDARTRSAEFAREGILAYEPYVAALAGVVTAQEALTEATENTTQVRTEQNKELAALTAQERRAATVIGNLKKTLTELFKPATSSIIGGALSFLEAINDFAKDSGVKSGLALIGRALGDMLKGMGRELGRSETRKGFAEIAKGAAGLVRVLGSDIFRTVFRLLMRVAREAMPMVLEGARAIGKRFRNWGEDVKGGGIRRFIDDVVVQFGKWKRLVGAVWDLVKAFFKDASKSGGNIVDHIREIVEGWTDWIEKNPDAVKTFFKDVETFAKSVLDLIDKIVRALDNMIALAKAAKDAYDFATKPVRDVADAIYAGDGETQATKERIIKDAQRGDQAAIRDLLEMGFTRQHMHALKIPGFATGGLIRAMFPGAGDRQPIMAEAGEYMIRKSVAERIGVKRLDLLNAGNLGALAGAGAGGRGGIHIEAINLPPAPGHAGIGDPRHTAAQLAKELRRRGGQGIGGGGVK